MGIQHMACSHICELYVYYKNYTKLMSLDIPLIVFPYVTHEPAHIDGYGPLPLKGWTHML